MAKRYPDKYRGAAIRDCKLYINGEVYTADDLESLPKDIRPSHTSTPGNSKVVVFFGKASCFSNHYTSEFPIDDIKYHSIEQYLAHNRARLANREDLMGRVLAASHDPTEAKRVLNLLHDEPGLEEWEDQRHNILFAGLVSKFHQSQYLREYLLSSGNRLLGEASRNNTWGIGLTLTDKDRLNPGLWKGENFLGKTLMEVREYLSTGVLPQSSPSTSSEAGGNASSGTPPQNSNAGSV